MQKGGDDDEEGGEDKESESDSGSKSSGGETEMKAKLDRIKKDKGGKGLKGKSGKIYSIVVETIKEINPVRLLMEFNPEIFLKVNGIDFERFKFPVNYFAEVFWTKFAKKAKMSKGEISKEVGADIEKRPEGVWLSLGNLLKLGTKKKISIGDYLQCLGLDLEPYEKKYDDYMIEVIQYFYLILIWNIIWKNILKLNFYNFIMTEFRMLDYYFFSIIWSWGTGQPFPSMYGLLNFNLPIFNGYFTRTDKIPILHSYFSYIEPCCLSLW